MQTNRKPWIRWLIAGMATAPCFLGLGALAQSTTPNVKVEILGVGTEFLLGGPLTDPEGDGLDEAGGATDPSWNWKNITSSIEPDFAGGENSFNIFDHKVGGGNDKWCCDDPTPDNPVWVDVEFATAVSITHFTVTSGNDTPGRDPVDWAIQGSNNGTTYTDIYRFFDTETPWGDVRNEVVKFTLPTPSAVYTHIRYIAYDTPANLHQLNEIEYFGGATAAVDTDKDGLPDDYETANGFNPNDASDAAKDFDKDGVTNLGEYTVGSNPTNTIAPKLISAAGSGSLNTVTLVFDDLENLDENSATNTANYSFSPSLTVLGATLKKKVVTLTTSAQTPGATAYTVTVTGVKDLSKNAVGVDNKALFYSYLLTRTGALKLSYWANITGTAVQALFDDPRYPASPDLTAAVFSFNSRDAFADDSRENYGATIEGFITPTVDGSYRFFDYSDDASQFFLSTDDKEANLALVAEEANCCNNFTEPDNARTSEPIALVAGRKYFARLVYKEGGGGDYGQIAWRKEGDTTPAGSLTPIPTQFLSSAVDLPADPAGAFTTLSPAVNAKNVAPDTTIVIGHRDGKTAWTQANTSLKFDGLAVVPTVTKVASVLTLTYTPPALLVGGSTHTITLGYLDAGGNAATKEWTFTVLGWTGPTKDKVGSYPGLIYSPAVYSEDKGGHSGAAGDYALDGTKKGGAVAVLNVSWLNPAVAANEVSVSFWQKKYDTSDSSSFYLQSPSVANSQRNAQGHTPWSNGHIYFDTAGCCDTDKQRLEGDFTATAEFTDASYWTNWHHYVFTKKGEVKQVWVDGKLFLDGTGADPLHADITKLFIGSGQDGTSNSHGLIDDFAVFSKQLVEADAKALAGGTLPSALAAAKGLVAYWDFNDAKTTPVAANLKAVYQAGGKIKVTFDGTATLQTSATVGGGYTDSTIKSGDVISADVGTLFLRVKP